jgi:hypothetical protein
MTIPDSDTSPLHSMYFKERYITTDFDFGETQINIAGCDCSNG